MESVTRILVGLLRRVVCAIGPIGEIYAFVEDAGGCRAVCIKCGDTVWSGPSGAFEGLDTSPATAHELIRRLQACPHPLTRAAE